MNKKDKLLLKIRYDTKRYVNSSGLINKYWTIRLQYHTDKVIKLLEGE